MSLRRAVLAAGFLLTRRFSPRRTAAPARSLHYLKDLPIATDGLRGAAGIAAAAVAAVGALLYNKGADDSAARKEEDMRVRFEGWVKTHNKVYRDEEEKAMRFEVFKDAVQWIESQPPSAQEKLLPESFFADFTHRERQRMHTGPMVDCKEFQDHLKEISAKRERGEPVSWRKGDKRSIPVSS